jgi:hypothetical protein
MAAKQVRKVDLEEVRPLTNVVAEVANPSSAVIDKG